MAYRHDNVLRRYVRDYCATAQEAALCFEALKQFLVVCAVGGGAQTSSQPVDDMWHTFLLFTRDYREFCEGHLGRFIAHRPGGGLPEGTYRKTRECAADLFVTLDENYWPQETDRADCDEGSGASGHCP
jgi:hypothetical protein